MIACMFIVAALVPLPKDELHLVGLYESKIRMGGQKIDVKPQIVVNRPGKEVTLFLSAHDSCTWQVIVAPNTTLKKVILGGARAQRAEVPKGVVVVEVFHDGRERRPNEVCILGYHKLDSIQFRTSAQAIRKFTGQELWSFQGSYNYDPTQPIVVKGVQDDERLLADYPKLTPAAELPKVTFQATYAVPTDRFQFAVSFGAFTQSGPDKKSLKALPNGIVSLTYDAAGKKHFGLKSHEIHEVDLTKGTSGKLDPGEELPKVSWPCSITFDTKRERLVVATLGGVGHLYTYTPKTGVWASPGNLNNIDLAALAYHPQDDNLYGVAQDRIEGGKPVLHQFNAQGALTGTTPLQGPIFPWILGQGPVESRVQLVSAGDCLAMLVTGVGARHENGNSGKGESFLYLIDPKTGKVKLAWKE